MRSSFALSFLIATHVGLASATASAAKLDLKEHNELISRLETVLPAVKGQKSETGVLVRLADLHADRARLKAIEETERNCNNCEKSKEDRGSAIRYYGRALKKANGQDKIKAVLQMAHLFSLNGDLPRAEKVFKNVVANRRNENKGLVGESYAGLAEIQFRRGDFDDAKKNFAQALKYPVEKESFIRYRLAWCDFNDGNTGKARAQMVSLLKAGKLPDPSFKRDLAKDLATFTAKDGITTTSIKEVLSLSPSDDKKTNLFYLGQEADRLGNRKGALLVWAEYAKLDNVSENESLEIQIRKAQNYLDQGITSQSLKIYEAFFKNLKKADCSEKDRCDELRSRARVYVHNWIKKEKTNPSADLLRGLEIYAEHNLDDIELIQWTGHVARHRKQDKKAAHYYHLAAEQSAKAVDKAANKTDRSFAKKILEGSLLAEIECAEKSGHYQSRRDAYDHYLALNPTGVKADEVRYQSAHLSYEHKDYKKAAAAFDTLVNDKNFKTSRLKNQAADLSLDCLALMKDKAELEKRALKYANLFPAKRKQFTATARKAIVNQALDQFKAAKSSEGKIEKALDKLKTAPLMGTTQAERLDLYKNQIVMAEKIKDTASVDSAARNILAMKKLSADDREYAFSRRLWVAEATLSFKTAFSLAKKMSFPELSEDERLLKLAMLAELAGKSSKGYYNSYLKKSRSLNKANAVRAKMVTESRRPWTELGRQKTHLKRTPSIYAATIAEVFAKSPSLRLLDKYLKERALRRSPYYASLRKFKDIDEDKSFDRKLARQKLRTRTERSLQSSLQERLKLLKQAEKKAKAAIRSGDFTRQVLALTRVQKENERLYKELLHLPIPKGLKKAERAQYQDLLRKNAEPFQKTAQNAEDQIDKLFDTSKSYKDMLKIAENDKTFVRRLAAYELGLLSSKALQNKSEMRDAIKVAGTVPRKSEVDEARVAVSKQPFNVEKIERLKQLELHRDEKSMVVFLDARLSETKKGKM